MFGGMCEDGESVEEAALREAFEELDWRPRWFERIGEVVEERERVRIVHSLFAAPFPGWDAITILEGSGARLVS